MTKRYLATAKRGKSVREQSGGVSRTDVRSHDALMRLARELWPAKTDVQLTLRTGAALRTSQYQLAGKRALSAEALIGLLHSEEGFRFLTTLMADAQPAWWRALQRQERISHLRKITEDQRRLIEALELQAAETRP